MLTFAFTFAFVFVMCSVFCFQSFLSREIVLGDINFSLSATAMSVGGGSAGGSRQPGRWVPFSQHLLDEDEDTSEEENQNWLQLLARPPNSRDRRLLRRRRSQRRALQQIVAPMLLQMLSSQAQPSFQNQCAFQSQPLFQPTVQGQAAFPNQPVLQGPAVQSQHAFPSASFPMSWPVGSFIPAGGRLLPCRPTTAAEFPSSRF